LIRTEGVRGLFQGFTATAARDAPYAGIYVVLYEEMKEVLGEWFGVLGGVGGKVGRS
jgi:solute carrier family 25 protein 38